MNEPIFIPMQGVFCVFHTAQIELASRRVEGAARLRSRLRSASVTEYKLKSRTSPSDHAKFMPEFIASENRNVILHDCTVKYSMRPDVNGRGRVCQLGCLCLVWSVSEKSSLRQGSSIHRAICQS